MAELVFHSPTDAAEYQTTEALVSLTVEEFAELLVLPLHRRRHPYSISGVSTEAHTEGPLVALAMWLANPANFIVVEDTREIHAQDLLPLPPDPQEILAFLVHIENLRLDLSDADSVEVWRAAKKLIYSELGHLAGQLSRDERRDFFDVLSTQVEVKIDWDLIPRKANAAAFVFIFSPFTDTGATVAAKRMRQSGDIFDVFSSNQEGRKKIDASVQRISDPYVSTHTVFDVDAGWATLPGITGFARHGARSIKRNLEAGASYDYIYSRAMWVHGIYAGAVTKTSIPTMKWVVEFSDPLSLGVSGDDRRGPKPVGEFFETLLKPVLQEYSLDIKNIDTVFSAAELIAYALADEIIFTNEHQKSVMLVRIPSTKLRERVEERAFVSNHPTLPPVFYDAVTNEYNVDNRNLNLAYFGEFYANRGLQDITAAIRQLPIHLRSRIHLHVFTDFAPASEARSSSRNMSSKQLDSLTSRTVQGVAAEGLEDQIHINASLPYLKFLSVTKSFDYLVVTDARANEHHFINPYLPSKWSDYKGSNVSTWALVEENSSLSAQPVEVITPIDSPRAISEALASMSQHKIHSSSSSIDYRVAPRYTSPNKTDYTQLLVQEIEQSDVEIYDPTGFIRPRLARFLRSYPQLPNFIKKFIPAKTSGPLYRPSEFGALLVRSRGDNSNVPSDKYFSELVVEEPLISENQTTYLEHVSYPYRLEAPLAVSYLAMEIAARARSIRANEITTSFRPIVGIASLMASRRLGIPLTVIIEDDVQALRVLESSQNDRDEHPMLDLLFVLATNADQTYFPAEISTEFSTHPALLKPASEAANERLGVSVKKPLGVYFGSGRYKQVFKELTELHEIVLLERLLVLVPDIVILDFSQHITSANGPEIPHPLKDLSKTENIINTLRKSGTVIVFIAPDGPTIDPSLQKIARIADVVSTDSLRPQLKYFNSRRVTPKVLFSAPGASQITVDSADAFENSWDEFATSVRAGKPAVPPVTSDGGWDSSRSMDNKLYLTKFTSGVSVPHILAAWEGVCELAQGHTAIDFGVHLIRAAGFPIDHPRAPKSTSSYHLEDIYNRATGEYPDSTDPNACISRIKAAYSTDTNATTLFNDDYELPSTAHRGVSLILPTYTGAQRIARMLDSIAMQSVPHELIEVIVVPNGSPDETPEIVTAWGKQHPRISLRIEVLKEAGVSAARNVGISLATKEYITFVDDDDYLGQNYIASMLARADRDIVVLGKLNDVFVSDNDGSNDRVDENTSMNKRVRSAGSTVQPLVRSWNALSMNAAKLIPAEVAKAIRYDTSLSSGEDQVYLVQLLKFRLQVTGARPMHDAGYMRIHRNGSVSRRPHSFQFSVVERLEVMSKFREISDGGKNSSLTYAAQNLARWHALAIVRYAETQKDDIDEFLKVISAIERAKFEDHREFKHFQKYFT